MKTILTINPGSTSTKIGVFEDTKLLFEKTLRHSAEEIGQYNRIIEQYDFRKNVIVDALKEENFDINSLDCIVGRGGLLKAIPSGVFAIDEQMLADLRDEASTEHASNLAAPIAYEIASKLNIPSFIVDPVVVDEFEPLARISGMPEIERISTFHALNQKAVAKRYAKENNLNYNELNLVVAHLGGGISVGAHKLGKVIDVNNALDGDGPMSPERSGQVPVGPLYHMAFSGKYTLAEMKKKNYGRGGCVAYLGTNDGREITKRIAEGDDYARLIWEALSYQVAKEIGSCATVLKGKVDAVILTGGLAYDKTLIEWIKERTSFIAPIEVYPGEDELQALCEGGLRVLNGEEQALSYKDESTRK